MLVHSAALLIATLTVPASADYFSVGPLPGNAPQGFSQVFTKHVDVLGCGHIYGSSSTSNSKMLTRGQCACPVP